MNRFSQLPHKAIVLNKSSCFYGDHAILKDRALIYQMVCCKLQTMLDQGNVVILHYQERILVIRPLFEVEVDSSEIAKYLQPKPA